MDGEFESCPQVGSDIIGMNNGTALCNRGSPRQDVVCRNLRGDGIADHRCDVFIINSSDFPGGTLAVCFQVLDVIIKKNSHGARGAESEASCFASALCIAGSIPPSTCCLNTAAASRASLSDILGYLSMLICVACRQSAMCSSERTSSHHLVIWQYQTRGHSLIDHEFGRRSTWVLRYVFDGH